MGSEYWVQRQKGGKGHPAGARAIGGSLHGAIQYVLHSEIKRMLEPQPVVNSLRRVQKGNPLMWIPCSHSNHGVVKEECLYKRQGKLPTIWISLTFLGAHTGMVQLCLFVLSDSSKVPRNRQHGWEIKPFANTTNPLKDTFPHKVATLVKLIYS